MTNMITRLFMSLTIICMQFQIITTAYTYAKIKNKNTGLVIMIMISEAVCIMAATLF